MSLTPDSSESDEAMPITLKDILKISELYKTAHLALREGTRPRFPVKPSLLERVSLL
jgi:hypothetical protein